MTQKLDKDISDGVWNKYLNKYTKKYQILVGEDEIRAIKCRFGEITPYSLVNRELLYYGDYKTNRKMNFQIKIIQKTGNIEITQQGDWEVCIKFKEEDLDKFCDVMFMHRRVALSDVLRLSMVERGKALAKKRWANSGIKTPDFCIDTQNPKGNDNHIV